MPEREIYMPIGRFARACRLSVKALRHYDEEGLLAPARVDSQSGYRYYARSQARSAVMIGMLRELRVSLPAIRAILAAGDAERADLLAREESRLQGEIARREQALRSLRRIARERSLTPYGVALREESAQPVARLEADTTLERLIPDTTALVYALFADLRAAGREPKAPVLCMNGEPDAEEKLRVSACVGVDPPLPRLARARADELSGGTFACVVHRGAYEELGLAYHALHAWVQEHGHEPRGPVRELYRNDPADVAPEELVTELLLPV
jgi:DNA-binding transcriptional MerR regulator